MTSKTSAPKRGAAKGRARPNGRTNKAKSKAAPKKAEAMRARTAGQSAPDSAPAPGGKEAPAGKPARKTAEKPPAPAMAPAPSVSVPGLATMAVSQRRQLEILARITDSLLQGTAEMSQQCASHARETVEAGTANLRAGLEQVTPAAYLRLQAEFAQASIDRALVRNARLSEIAFQMATDSWVAMAHGVDRALAGED